MTRIGINGFGRMGRLALRAAWGRPGLDVVHINEVAGGVRTAAHLLTFDSVHGRWAHDVSAAADDALIVDGKRIAFTDRPRPGSVDWRKHGVDLVLECSGKFRSTETLEPYFSAGVRKVIVAAPVKSGALNVVMGVNDHLYDPAAHHLITAASCTTNCLAPIVKVVHQSIGIRHGFVTTVHDLTNTQTVVDAPHKDLRRAREQRVADPDEHRIGDGDRSDLSGTEGQADRHRRACAAAQRVAHRLCLRGGARHVDRRGQRRVQGCVRRAAVGRARL